MNNKSVTKCIQKRTHIDFTLKNKNLNGVVMMKSHFGGEFSKTSLNIYFKIHLEIRNNLTDMSLQVEEGKQGGKGIKIERNKYKINEIIKKIDNNEERNNRRRLARMQRRREDKQNDNEERKSD